MAKLKTIPQDSSVEAFLDQVADPDKRADNYALLEIMKTVTGEQPVMWGGSIVGFGSYHYRYASGREGDWMLTGFSPRKQQMSLYIMSGFDQFEELLNALGKYKTGKSCLYIKSVSDIDLEVLKQLIKASVEYLKARYPDKE
ncbi:MAG: DUF1801 domain-containing protein [Mameliella sp.]|nr:DUF1801 domain-containing protein [Phaeodactylibacter sp.]